MTDKAGSGESQAGGGTGGGVKQQNNGHVPALPAVATAAAPAHPTEAHDSIAQNLRKVYQSTVDEPVPDTIADLLSRLS